MGASRAAIAPLLFLAACLVWACSLPSLALAWGNGGNTRTKYLSDLATKTANFSSEASFTVNLLPIQTGEGYGLGTHDYILEQGIAQAIKAGADVSWLNVVQAQQGTSDPDKVASVRKRLGVWAHHWYGAGAVGTAPYTVGCVYQEVAAALEAGDTKTASRKFGWIAHLLGDMTMPMHIAGYSRYIPESRNHLMHVAAEADLDYYQRYSIGRPRNKWSSDVEAVVGTYLPKASTITTTTPPQVIRKLWFDGSYAKPTQLGKSAREVTLAVDAKVRKNYAKDFFINWGKTWKTGYVSAQPDGTHPSRGTGTEYLVSTAPKLMKTASDGVASLLVTLSDPATRAQGIDHIRPPVPKVSAPNVQVVKKKSKTGRLILSAKGSKRKKLMKKYLAAPKKLSYALAVTVKQRTTNKAVGTLPLVVTWKNSKGKVLKSATLWTTGKGVVKTSYVLTTPKKKAAFSVSIGAPTTDLAGTTKVVTFSVDPKEHVKKFK